MLRSDAAVARSARSKPACANRFCSRGCCAGLTPGDAVDILCALADQPACAPLGPHLLRLLDEEGRCR